MALRDLRSQDQSVQVLQRAWATDKLHHGWLIAGPSGVGKTLLAHELARLLVCDTPTEEGDACGRCRSCHMVDHGGHPDLIWVKLEDGKKLIAVSQIRELRARLEYPPHNPQGRAVIFERAELMTVEAQNALLKTLEEPTARTYLLLTTAHPSQLLPTVISRCSRLDLAPLPKATLEDIIRESEPASLDDREISLAASLSAGSVTVALELLESGLEELTELVEQLDEALERRDVPQLLALAEPLSKDRARLRTALELLALWYRDVMFQAAGAESSAPAFAHKQDLLERRAEALGVRGAGEHIEAAMAATEALGRRNANARLTVESMLLRMLS